MKFLIAFAAVIAVCLAAPLDDSKNAQILRYENDNIGLGGYNFAYETSDGQARQENAELKNIGTENEALVVRGSYSFVADDGQTYTVTYIADENGFQPSAPHIPKN
ncbi:CLUMA_CG016569, isoform A [Clunio marinus]|uniref:CLUMA_CG016569, isoform A n=1 Tax=Clunio marinus TaxID=568069 RepID=A0A1J1IRW4_9DIPT|nr:CLUMA_CG016569, isoform A [Clunio marinus]